MRYVDFGKTGVSLSRLGMGCMHFPFREKDGKNIYDMEKSTALIHRAIEVGVNYLDTAPYYCDGMSEEIVGKALKGRREKVYVSTKCPIDNDSGDEYDRWLERSLKKLDTSYIDFYHFWAISLDKFCNRVMEPDGPFERAKKAKSQGLIKHISFSFHDSLAREKEGDNLMEILKRGEGLLESLLCQYNIMDRNKGPGLELAHKMEIGTAVMGPLGGGRLASPGKAILDLLPARIHNSAELALRFVMSNEAVNVVLSGIANTEELEENARVTDNASGLSQDELNRIEMMMKENERLAGLYCTGCNYCMPCPAGLNIPEIFKIMNYHRVYGITDYAKKAYAEIGKNIDRNYANASACTGCGECEEKCPQKLPVREQLEETRKILAG